MFLLEIFLQGQKHFKAKLFWPLLPPTFILAKLSQKQRYLEGQTMLNPTHNSVPSDAFHNSSHVTKKLTFDLKQWIKYKWDDLPTPQLLREAKDHPQPHMNHLQKTSSSSSSPSFLVDEGASAYQASCCSQRSPVLWCTPPFPSHYFSRQKHKKVQVADF